MARKFEIKDIKFDSLDCRFWDSFEGQKFALEDWYFLDFADGTLSMYVIID